MRASVNACTPVILGDLVFASTSYGKGATLLAVDGAELKTVWTNDTSMSCHYSSCVMNNGLLFGFHGRQEAGADLRCVDFKTGRVHWSQPGLRSGTVTRAGDAGSLDSESKDDSSRDVRFAPDVRRPRRAPGRHGRDDAAAPRVRPQVARV